MWSGVVNAHEKDYRTAYSYLYEALEAFSVANDPKAFDSLKSFLQTCRSACTIDATFGKGFSLLPFFSRSVVAGTSLESLIRRQWVTFTVTISESFSLVFGRP